MKVHSKLWTKPILLGDDENPRKYQAQKLNTRHVSIEGFKIIKALMPSIGTAVDMLTNKNEDMFDIPQTFSAIFLTLNQNLTEEQLISLEDKLLATLTFNGEVVEDWSDHFDQYPQDFLDVFSHLCKESFTTFFMGSAMLQNMLDKLLAHLPQEQKSILSQVWKLK